MNYYTINIRSCSTEDKGTLSFFEGMKDFPFDIKRIYYIYGVGADVVRGGHAHKELKQILFCPYGKIILEMDDGKNKKDIVLDEPSKAIVILKPVWRNVHWMQDNSVLCAAVSDYYDENDYIRDYSDFKEYINRGMSNE